MVIETFFRTATDARYAIRDFKRQGLSVKDDRPIPVAPNNGRPWRVDVTPEVGLTERHAQAPLLVLVSRIATAHNGITEQVDRSV